MVSAGLQFKRHILQYSDLALATLLQDGITAVAKAARGGHTEALLVLLKAGADPTKADNVSVQQIYTPTHIYTSMYCASTLMMLIRWVGGGMREIYVGQVGACA